MPRGTPCEAGRPERLVEQALGRDGDLLAKLPASLANLDRVLGFLGEVRQ